MFVVERLEELRTLLGAVADNNPDFEHYYTLEPAEVAAISRQFDVPFDPEGRETQLCPWRSIREVPYLVHTGYELPLMIEGRKQFARISEEYPPSRHAHEECFDRYVARGVLHKEVDLEKFPKPVEMKDGRVFEGVRTVYYTLKGEEWRIAAWRLISRAAAKSGWNEGFERIEGMLLGYEEWQNDWWIEAFRKRRETLRDCCR